MKINGKFEHISSNENSYDYVKLPQRSTKGSAGYDFFSPDSFLLYPNDEVVIRTGVKCKIEPGWFLMICPRSSLGFKYKARLANTVGIVDSDYYNNKSNEGHILIKICNEGPEPLFIDQGKAFAQGIFLPYGVLEDDDVEAIREGGIGSSDS